MEFDSALLASIASGGLGHWVELDNGSRKYCKDDDCVACLKDLQGFFRFDDQVERPAFFAVSKYNFAKTDLVPLLVTYPEDYDVVYNTCACCDSEVYCIGMWAHTILILCSESVYSFDHASGGDCSITCSPAVSHDAACV